MWWWFHCFPFSLPSYCTRCASLLSYLLETVLCGSSGGRTALVSFTYVSLVTRQYWFQLSRFRMGSCDIPVRCCSSSTLWQGIRGNLLQRAQDCAWNGFSPRLEIFVPAWSVDLNIKSQKRRRLLHLILSAMKNICFWVQNLNALRRSRDGRVEFLHLLWSYSCASISRAVDWENQFNSKVES